MSLRRERGRIYSGQQFGEARDRRIDAGILDALPGIRLYTDAVADAVGTRGFEHRQAVVDEQGAGRVKGSISASFRQKPTSSLAMPSSWR